MTAIGNQQGYAVAVIDRDYLPHQPLCVENRLAHIDPVIAAAINSHRMALGVGRNTDYLSHQHTVHQQFCSIEQLAQAQVFCGKFRHTL